MAGETSDPGSPGANINPDIAEEENLMAGMTQAESDAAIAGAANDPSYDDFSGSTALANQQQSSLTGSRFADAFVPGIGALNVISSISAQQTQANLQRGADPVYGSSGNVVGTMGPGLFGGRAYTGASEGNPNPPIGSDDNNAPAPAPAVVKKRTTRKTVKRGVSNDARPKPRILPRTTIRGTGAPSLAPRLRSRGGYFGVQTSRQGILGSAPVQRKTLLGS